MLHTPKPRRTRMATSLITSTSTTAGTVDTRMGQQDTHTGR